MPSLELIKRAVDRGYVDPTKLLQIAKFALGNFRSDGTSKSHVEALFEIVLMVDNKELAALINSEEM